MHFIKQEQTNAALWDTISLNQLSFHSLEAKHCLSWGTCPELYKWRWFPCSPRSTDSRKASYYHDCHSKQTDLSVHACQDLSSAALEVWNVDHQLTQSRAKTAGLCLMLYTLFQALRFSSSTGQALISGGDKQALKYLLHSNFTFGMKCLAYFVPVPGNGLRNDASLWLNTKRIPLGLHTQPLCGYYCSVLCHLETSRQPLLRAQTGRVG